MKIKELKPWEVMKYVAENGKKNLVWKSKDEKDYISIDLYTKFMLWDWTRYDYAIIEDTVDWDKFNWNFFNQYGGVFVKNPSAFTLTSYVDGSRHIPDNISLLISPWYYWPGGEQPVPDNVEVEIIYHADRYEPDKGLAYYFDWSKNGSGSDIIAFRIVGTQ